MTIDVNSCTGCSACVAACYAENNVQVVGRENVSIGRIMSWIRVERFFPRPGRGGQSPPLYLAPILCQQCDHAPCEPVCPVFASHHTDEGLNAQIYNRCIGTRFCENNCPYKVRRFNWYGGEWEFPLNYQLNPDVTVRGAGVMEKCTFCIQRITTAEIDARTENRKLLDGEIITACAQACPCARDQLWRYQRSEQRDDEAARRTNQAPQLHDATRVQCLAGDHLSARYLSDQGESLMAAAVDTTNIEPTYLDIDRAVQQTLRPGGLKYWMWVLFCASMVALGIGFWTRQIYEGLWHYRLWSAQ